MILRVLGCSGSEMPDEHHCSFLVGTRVLIDMGAASAGMPLADRPDVTDIFLTHAHLDHTKDLCFFAESVYGLTSAPIRIRGTAETLDLVRRHLLNDSIWPDFTALPTPETPVLRYESFEPREVVSVQGLSVRSFLVPHMPGSVGFVLASGSGALVLSGDTGSTDELARVVLSAGADLRALLIEVSLPDRLQSLARASGHLTPRALGGILRAIPRQKIPVYAYHLKAPFRTETIAGLERLGDDRIRVLEPGMEIEF